MVMLRKIEYLRHSGKDKLLYAAIFHLITAFTQHNPHRHS